MALVARREVTQRVRDRSLLISTLLTIAVLGAVLLLPKLLGLDGATKATVAAAGPQAEQLVAQARRQQRALDVELTLKRVASDAEARRLVEAEEADVAVVAGGNELVAKSDPDEGVVGTLQAASANLRAGGELPPPLPVRTLQSNDDGSQEAVAFVALVILYGQFVGYGYWVAFGVVEEKSSRVVELLLSTIRPRELLAGKVIGIGLVGLGQLLLIGVLGAAVGVATGELDLDGGVIGALAIVLAWFLLGYAFYSCAFAVAGALVPRQEEVQNVTTPLLVLILGSFFLSFSALEDANSPVAQVMSFLPPSAPMVMPVRLIVGDVAAWEVIASVLITLAGAVALIVVAGRIYGAAVLRTGGRVKLRAAWRAAEETP